MQAPFIVNSFKKAYREDYVHAYADDNQLYISFKLGSSASELEAVTALQDCIINIKTCMTADKLKLNDVYYNFFML